MIEMVDKNELALMADAMFVPTRVGLVVTGNPTVVEWGDFGSKIRQVEGAIQWLIGDWLNYGELRYGDKYKEAIKNTGYDYQSVANEKTMAGRFQFSRRRENLSWSHHQAVQGVHPDEDGDKLLDEAEANDWSVKELREAVRDINRTEPESLPSIEGEYDIIYADPPWKYDVGTTTPERQIEHQYPTMELEDIKAMDVPSAENAMLFLWVTSPKLEEGLSVLNAWGFTYRTSMVWDKERMGLGHIVRIQHEYLLIGRKGKMASPPDASLPRSVIREKSARHSRKPGVVYRIIEDMYPEARKIELFARGKRPGWTSWGDEMAAVEQREEMWFNDKEE
jgi:N6-adenosine-specific RNA methylase IME4